MALKCHRGGRESNSYVTQAEADVIVPKYYPSDLEWAALSAVEKELRLVLAADLMNQIPFLGYRMYGGQRLAFPRTCNGGSGAIPDEVKEAQVLIAIGVIHRALAQRTSAVSDDVSEDTISAISLGGLLSVSFRQGSQSGSLLNLIFTRENFPIMARLGRFVAQIRGRSVPNINEMWGKSTTTTTESTTTTSTSFTTTSSTTSTTTTTLP